MAKNKYNPDTFPLLAEGYARDGLINEQIAEKLGISVAAYYNYQKDHIEFLEAIKRGKSPVDREVENMLLKRARGYDYEEVRTESIADKEGNVLAVSKKINITKHIIPDVTAQIFWLKNRKPAEWRDKQEIDHQQSGEWSLTVKIIDANGKTINNTTDGNN